MKRVLLGIMLISTVGCAKFDAKRYDMAIRQKCIVSMPDLYLDPDRSGRIEACVAAKNIARYHELFGSGYRQQYPYYPYMGVTRDGRDILMIAPYVGVTEKGEVAY